MQGNLARPVWGWGPGEIPGPTPLFAGTDKAGENHARLWSLIASAERHGLDPQSYLTSVLSKIAGTPVGDLDQFLPDVWQRESAPEPLVPE
jgi:hypothetical protein